MKTLAILYLSVITTCFAKPSIWSVSEHGPIAPLINPLRSWVPWLSTPQLVHSAPILHQPIYPLVHSAPIIHHSAPLVQHAVVEAAVVEGVKHQYHSQDILGQASYGHSEPGQSHSAVQDAHGNKIGSFSYVRPDGKLHRTDYVADAAGYRVASNDLPVGPANSLPSVHLLRKRSIQQNSYYTPTLITPTGHVADTPEVAAAKAAHFAEHAKRAGGYQSNYIQAPLYSTNVPIVTSDGFIADTPEVAAAKAAHFAEKSKSLQPAYPSYIQHQYTNQIPQQIVQHAVQEPVYPVITPSGHIADTPEVAAAKAAHFAEVAAAQQRAVYSPDTDSHSRSDINYDDDSSAHDDGSYKQQDEDLKQQLIDSQQEYLDNQQQHQQQLLSSAPQQQYVQQQQYVHQQSNHLIPQQRFIYSGRNKRSIAWGETPANTVPLGTPLLVKSHTPVLAVHEPLVYQAPLVSTYHQPLTSLVSTYHQPLAYHAPLLPLLKHQTQTTIVHSPYGAVSTRIDSN